MPTEGKGAVTWKRVGLAAGPVVFALIALVPSGLHRIEGYGSRPAYAAAVAALMVVWWFTEALPIGVTACVPLLLFPLLGVFGQGLTGDALRSATPYGNAYVFLFMGGMTLGAAMEQRGLHRRVALHIMRAIGTEPRRLLLGVLVTTATASMWISNTASAVMMMPIGMALLAQLESAGGGKRLAHYGSAIMLAVAYGANVGGVGTKIGTGTNSVFVGYLSETMGYEMGFLQYMAVGMPFVVLFVPVLWWALWRHARLDAPRGTAGREVLDGELRRLGPMSRMERLVAAVFLSAAVAWILGDPLRAVLTPLVPAPWEGFKLQGKHYEAAVAMAAALTLVLTRAVSFAALKKVPWGTLLLIGGSFAMAGGIEGSGLSGWLTVLLRPVSNLPLVAQLALASFATVVISAFASNTATINLTLNMLPRSMVVLSASSIAASCDFALPAGTPPNAIVFGSGYIRLPTMMRTGALLDLAAALLITAYAYLYLSLLLP